MALEIPSHITSFCRARRFHPFLHFYQNKADGNFSPKTKRGKIQGIMRMELTAAVRHVIDCARDTNRVQPFIK